MLTIEEKQRLEYLEAKAYFEEELSKKDEKELDTLIAKANNKQ